MAVYSCNKRLIRRNTCVKHVIWFIAEAMAHRSPGTELYMQHAVTDTSMTTLTCMTVLCSAHYCAAKPQWGYKVNTAAAGPNTQAQVLGRLQKEAHSKADCDSNSSNALLYGWRDPNPEVSNQTDGEKPPKKLSWPGSHLQKFYFLSKR